MGTITILPNLLYVDCRPDVTIYLFLDHDSVDDVYVAVANTAALFRHQRGVDVVQFLDLYDVLPTHGTMIQPAIKIAPLGSPLNNQVVVFEEKVKTDFIWL